MSGPIIAWYFTQIIGDGRNPPTLLASANFTGPAVIGTDLSLNSKFSEILRWPFSLDADPYIPNGGGAQWYVNQDNLCVYVSFMIIVQKLMFESSFSYRSVRNFVIDLTEMPATAPAVGLHWQVSQATSLMNIVVNMSEEPGTTHEGIS